MALRFRGLAKFVHEVKNCENPELEFQTLDKELKKIQTKLLSQQSLNGYKRKKYLWKLAFIKLMGMEVNFGYKEILSLVGSPKHSEKYTGYITAAVIVPEHDEEDVYRSIKEQVKADLFSMNESFQSLALGLIGTVAHEELAVPLVNHVLKLALGENNQITSGSRKKALLCLLRIFRKYPKSFENTRNWIAPLNAMIEKFSDYSILNAAVALAEGITAVSYTKHWDEISPGVMNILHKLVMAERIQADYLHYGVPHPWLQIKCLKLMQNLSVQKKPELVSLLNQILRRILSRVQISNDRYKNNTEFSVLFEAIRVIVKYRAVVELDLQHQVLSLIFMFLELQEPNIKYLTFDSMTSVLALPGSEDLMKDHVPKILEALNDFDISMRRRALDLLYLMCNAKNVGSLTEELLIYSDNCDANLKEELVLKIAILAEKFAPDMSWYVDVVIKLLSTSGDYITDDIWWRVSQIITGFGDEKPSNKKLQSYALGGVVRALSTPNVHENLIKLGSYVLPEYGPRNNLPATKAFAILNKHFTSVSTETKCMLFDGYAKIAASILQKSKPTNDEVALVNEINATFQMYAEHIDVELQKRSWEYLMLLDQLKPEQLAIVFKEIPTFHESVQENNPLLSKMIKIMGGQQEDKSNAMDLIAKHTEILDGDKADTAEEDMVIEAKGVFVKFDSVPVFDVAKHRMALKSQNILLTPSNLEYPRYGYKEFKNLLMNPVGALYQDNSIQIDLRSEYKEAQGMMSLTFNSKAGPIKITKIKITASGHMTVQQHPIKDEDAPKVRLLFTNTNSPNRFPEVQVFYRQSAIDKTLTLKLPVFINKFMSPKALDENKYMDYYTKMTIEDSFYKLDDFIRNPAPDQPINEVMKKICSLLNQVIKLAAQPYPSAQNIKMVYASGQVHRANAERASVPVLVEIECFEESREYLRLSIRCFSSGRIARAIHRIIVLFLSK